MRGRPLSGKRSACRFSSFGRRRACPTIIFLESLRADSMRRFASHPETSLRAKTAPRTSASRTPFVGQALRLPVFVIWQATRLPYNYFFGSPGRRLVRAQISLSRLLSSHRFSAEPDDRIDQLWIRETGFICRKGKVFVLGQMRIRVRLDKVNCVVGR